MEWLTTKVEDADQLIAEAERDEIRDLEWKRDDAIEMPALPTDPLGERDLLLQA
jgi:hypothetical protein